MSTAQRPTPPHSRSSSAGSNSSSGSLSNKRQRVELSLDLSDLPPLVTPAPPSNTLLVTNLNDPEIFAQASLAQIRDLVDTHSQNSVYTYSPLRSMRRIIITFHSIEAATTIRSLLDGESLFNSRIRIYFGEPTPIVDPDSALDSRLLKAPKADKQFFISPPPSPPVGWEVRDEGPPNKDTHAEDLALALERLNAKGVSGLASATTAAASTGAVPAASAAAIPTASSSSFNDRPRTPPRSTAAGLTASDEESTRAEINVRKRSGSVIVYDPSESGHSPTLPAIAVEDTTGDTDMNVDDGPNIAARMTMPRTELPPTGLSFSTDSA